MPVHYLAKCDPFLTHNRNLPYLASPSINILVAIIIVVIMHNEGMVYLY